MVVFMVYFSGDGFDRAVVDLFVFETLGDLCLGVMESYDVTNDRKKDGCGELGPVEFFAYVECSQSDNQFHLLVDGEWNISVIHEAEIFEYVTAVIGIGVLANSDFVGHCLEEVSSSFRFGRSLSWRH